MLMTYQGGTKDCFYGCLFQRSHASFFSHTHKSHGSRYNTPVHNNSSRSVPRLRVFLSSKSSDFYYCLNCFQPLKSFLPKLPDCFKLKWFTNARDNHKISTTVKIGSDQFTISIDIRRIRTCRLTKMNHRVLVMVQCIFHIMKTFGLSKL